jgi:hypothetical protein
MTTRVETDRNVDPAALARAVQAELGLDLTPAVTSRPPGQPDEDGEMLPGVVQVDADLTPERLAVLIAEAIPGPTAADRIAAARSLDELKAVLVDLVDTGQP